MLDQALTWPQYVLNAYAESMRAIDHRPHLASLSCPIIIVQGRHDRKQRYEGAVHMARMIPGAQLVTFENSSTMANIEEVDAFTRAVAEFARDLAAKAAA